MEELQELKNRMENQRPAPWEALPDLSLYMDQVIGYMPRQLIQYGEGERLTSAMVNNYIKDGLVPRAEGKRYGPVHLGYLTAMCALKRVLSVREIGVLLSAAQARGNPPETLYGYFTNALDAALTETARSLEELDDPKDLARTALDLALRSYANQLACARLLDIMQESGQAGPSPKKTTK